MLCYDVCRLPALSFFAYLVTIRYLSLAGNFITGPLSPFISELTRLTYLDISQNYMTSTLPPTLRNLVLLQHFDAGQQSFDGASETTGFFGTLPDEYSAMTSLT